jgi:hypothetical protein
MLMYMLGVSILTPLLRFCLITFWNCFDSEVFLHFLTPL